ncbi:MAG: hypothetical protein FWH02_07930 [Oscillospiraceae bacterium]|nr:hypothetical protein [Oscillospiraceae bacterium]
MTGQHRPDRIEILTERGKDCVRKYSERARNATFLPLVSIPAVHSLCAAMLSDLDKIFGTRKVENEKASNIALGILASPFMLVPLWGAIPAMAYIETVGESYIKALVNRMHAT